MSSQTDQAASSRVPIILTALLALAIGAIVFQWLKDNQPGEVDTQTLTLLTPGKQLQSFELVDHKGQVFGMEQLQGQWNVLFFGFTNCPDICPTTMQLLKSIKDDLQQKQAWEGYRVLFVSVDPKRDTAEQLSRYVPFFDQEFVGLTGTDQQVSEFARQLSMPYIAEEPDDRGNYNVSHSASILLVGPNAALRGIISAPHDRSAIASDLALLHGTF